LAVVCRRYLVFAVCGEDPARSGVRGEAGALCTLALTTGCGKGDGLADTMDEALG
jgi:hypothetical protein